MKNFKDDKKNILKNNIDILKSSIESIKNDMEFDVTDLTMINNDFLPGLNLDMKNYDYVEEMKSIKSESIDTLNCLSSLYLDDIIKENKNISNIIKNDATAISDIKFSLSCARRGLINCMEQLDAGSNDPEMHQAVNSYQKEIRDSNKMIYDLLSKMKEFYKSLRDELKNNDIKTDDVNIPRNDEDIHLLFDNNMMNKVIDNLMIKKIKK
jgi:hypothetical protein